MSRVDADNDEIRRFVVYRYAYDPERRERRHRVVAAFDDGREFYAFIEQASAELRMRRTAGDDVDPTEHYSGTVLQPGDRRRARDRRILARAIAHGVDVTEISNRLEFPPAADFVFRAT